jgi:hypothetical protein
LAFCTGDEVIPPKPTPPVPGANASQTETTSLNREYKDDRAIGTISNLIEPDQFEHIDGKGTAKEAWDALSQKHADSHTGLAVFYIKVGMLNKRYTDGESMHAHLSFFTTKNRKLDKKAFDDEFLAQVMLMSRTRQEHQGKIKKVC